MTNYKPEKLRVLVADDEVVIADTLARILRNHGYHADSVYSPFEIIERTSTEEFDFLVTDVVMGDQMSGIDAAIEILKVVPRFKVLLISGEIVTSRLLLEAEDKGYKFEILPKPIHPTDILEKLKSMNQS